ncbi:hypothetical protein L1987_09529 [Smallanthus sonchifolius]|uniref:Uncharacterized protein n=1 Tax=Smallanthus sonchifolius TaxID=185202 RepID=A0ACB9JPC6_9ASTR|nr:hypothetical protein L1987_09529 [Smallanthus sonchifolius]
MQVTILVPAFYAYGIVDSNGKLFRHFQSRAEMVNFSLEKRECGGCGPGRRESRAERWGLAEAEKVEEKEERTATRQGRKGRWAFTSRSKGTVRDSLVNRPVTLPQPDKERGYLVGEKREAHTVGVLDVVVPLLRFRGTDRLSNGNVYKEVAGSSQTE